MSDTDADEGDETAKALSLVSPAVVNSQFFNARPIIDLSSSETEIDSFLCINSLQLFKCIITKIEVSSQERIYSNIYKRVVYQRNVVYLL